MINDKSLDLAIASVLSGFVNSAYKKRYRVIFIYLNLVRKFLIVIWNLTKQYRGFLSHYSLYFTAQFCIAECSVENFLPVTKINTSLLIQAIKSNIS